MAPRRNAKQGRCIAVVEKNGSDEARLAFIPADPADPRLTLDGAILNSDGKINVEAYRDLMPAFAGEPQPDMHPYPERPGVRTGEAVAKGLRIWDDLRAGNAFNNGAGWIASRSTKVDGKKEKWFNIQTCGSWRMAFLLARLQRDLWVLHAPSRLTPNDNMPVVNTVIQKRLRLRCKTSEAAWLSSNAAATLAAAPTEKPLKSTRTPAKRNKQSQKAHGTSQGDEPGTSTPADVAQSSSDFQTERMPVATPTKKRSRTGHTSADSARKRPRQVSNGQSVNQEPHAAQKPPTQQLRENDRLSSVLERFRARIQAQEASQADTNAKGLGVKETDAKVESNQV